MNEQHKEMWIRFACAALSTTDDMYDVDNPEGIKRDCADAAAYADEMCRLFYETFRGC